jgi:transforming growth factor-beta-induced protein
MRKLLLPILALVAVLATAAVAFGGGGDSPAQPATKAPKKNIVETAVGAGQFDTLVSLVQKAGLAETLSGKGPYTVFAPTDKAFEKVPAETLAKLGDDPEALKRVLLYHVADGRYPAARVVREDSINTLAGPRVDVQVRGDVVRVGGARVIMPDVRASNGVIHAINRVLIPPTKPAARAPKKNIVETAVAAGQFDTLVSLVKQAGLAETLSGKGPYTIFAPTDKAFKKVPADTLKALGDDRDALERVLLYHVADGRYPAARVARKQSIETLAGPRLKVQVRGDVVRVGGARVITPDVRASNGIVHAINRVLIPPK